MCVGLGWALDEISFACHMFMHFPCIRTLCSYICHIWTVLGLFWLSPSLSLSPFHSFTLVVSMAPKRKATPARNPMRSRASSSFDSATFDVRFRDRDAQKAFSENFSRRGVHSEHQVILADFADTDLPSVIHSRGGSHCVTSRSLVLSCLFRSSTPTCTGLIVQYLSFSLAFKVRTFLSHRSLLRMCFGFLG